MELKRIGLLVGALGILAAIFTASESSAAPTLHRGVTPEGVPYGWVGDLPKKPAPTVIFLGGDIATNLTASAYAEGVDAICKVAFCITLDGPSEGSDRKNQRISSLEEWAVRAVEREDFVSKFVTRSKTMLDYLIGQGKVDPQRIGIFGTSRGAYIGFHLAASDPRIKAIAAFSPLTNLTALSEFQADFNTKTAASKLTMISNAELRKKLPGIPIWITIGSSDTRVGTDEAIRFSRSITEAAIAKKAPPVIELRVLPADGHNSPAGSYADGAAWMKKQLNIQGGM
ncbi:alpha/beta hydrolase family protein [Herbaspirillum chlorophenolicum]|uniref:Alpha/beta hydrolase family protein n=1 Tax=Herbaspirillum chlorophenolicum TaxID=211589 RepID=A0ABW8EV30_9BURK